MKILFEDNHLLVVEKPVNIPMQLDSSLDLDLLSMAKAYLVEKYDKEGNVYCGLVHRLDRPVGGVVVFAKTSKAAARLSASMRQDKWHKKYEAMCVGKLPYYPHFIDYLHKDPKTNTSKVVAKEKGKYSELSFIELSSQSNLHHVEIDLKTGRSHQIRVQFASRNCPIWGDQRYNPEAITGQQIALWAMSLTFPHPISNELLTFTSQPPQTYPWI